MVKEKRNVKAQIKHKHTPWNLQSGSSEICCYSAAAGLNGAFQGFPSGFYYTNATPKIPETGVQQ